MNSKRNAIKTLEEKRYMNSDRGTVP